MVIGWVCPVFLFYHIEQHIQEYISNKKTWAVKNNKNPLLLFPSIHDDSKPLYKVLAQSIIGD